MEEKYDVVNKPKHYTDGKIEVIDFIEDKKLNFHLGNVVKYVARAGKKDDILQDLQKAQWYLNREIETLKKQREAEKIQANNKDMTPESLEKKTIAELELLLDDFIVAYMTTKDKYQELQIKKIKLIIQKKRQQLDNMFIEDKGRNK